MDLEKLVYYNNLFEVYSFSLSEEQRCVFQDFITQNLGVSEIAENKGISRQAVSKFVKNAIKKLEKMEQELKIVALSTALKDDISKIEMFLGENNIEKAKEQIKKMKKRL